MPKTHSPKINKIAISKLPEQLKSIWQEAHWMLEGTYVIDGRHLLLVFYVDHAFAIMESQASHELTKYVDCEDYAPYRAKELKLATLRHYRKCHQDLEGTGDPMEGRSSIKSSLKEFLDRHHAKSTLHGTQHIATEVVYQTDGTSLIYCTSRDSELSSRFEQWGVASVIRNIPRFTVLLGTEFARQRDEFRHAAVTGLDRIVDSANKISKFDSVVHVYHGPVAYHDNAGKILFEEVPEPARAITAHFYKGKTFENQREYRFVLYASGGRPVQDEFLLRITPDLRRMFEKA